MLMVADLSAANAAEKFLRPIRAGAVEAVRLFVIDPADFELAAKAISRGRFVGGDDSSPGDAGADE
jgi:hypothetical protein